MARLGTTNVYGSLSVTGDTSLGDVSVSTITAETVNSTGGYQVDGGTVIGSDGRTFGPRIATDAHSVFRVYSATDAAYGIGFKSGQTYGYLNDYATTFTMNAVNARGWLFRDTSDTAAQGSMSLTTDGKMMLANRLSFQNNQNAYLTTGSASGSSMLAVTRDASPMAVERNSGTANVNIRYTTSARSDYAGFDGSGVFKVGASQDLSGSGNTVWHSGNSNKTTINWYAQDLQLGNGRNLSWGGIYSNGAPTIAASSDYIAIYPDGNVSGLTLKIEATKTTSYKRIHTTGVTTTSDIILAAATGTGSSADTPDIVFTDSAGVETGRFYRNASGPLWRNSGSTATYTMWHSGNLTPLTGTDYLRANASDTFSGGVLAVNNNAGTSITHNTTLNGLQVYQGTAGADATMSFHIGGDYACHFGLDGGTNKLSVGGWSMGGVSHPIYHAGNKPTLAELGAAASSHTHSYLPLSGGTMTGDISMRANQVNWKTNGSVTAPQFLGARSGTALNSRVFADEGGVSYTTYEGSAADQPESGTNNANGLLTFNTHNGAAYTRQLSFNSHGKIHYRTSTGTWAQVLTSATGNAVSASKFNTGRTNYKGVTDDSVIGQIMWKNYGNNHTIIDASAGTSPSGTAIDKTNSATAWTANYPTLMGWNGTSTYGVRVDKCRQADGVSVTHGFSGNYPVTVNVSGKIYTHGGMYYDGAQTSLLLGGSGSYNPWLTLHGADSSAERCGLSIGESGRMGDAALHIYYTGDGWSHVGMGTMTSSTNPSYESMRFYYRSTTAYCMGNLTAYYSDERLKDVKEDIDQKEALASVCSWRKVRYTANELGQSFGYEDKQEIGLLAGEIQETYPELTPLAPFDMGDTPDISKSGENYRTLDYERIVAVQAAAITELEKRLKALEEKING